MYGFLWKITQTGKVRENGRGFLRQTALISVIYTSIYYKTISLSAAVGAEERDINVFIYKIL